MSVKKFEFETFQSSNYFLERAMETAGPFIWNGEVSVQKYKVTKELVEEPVEVLHERLQYLWDHSDNSHHSEPLRQKAKELGYELVGNRGNKRVR